jgi:hypothetical protein
MIVDDSKAGKVGRCLKCNQKFLVPREARKPTGGVAQSPPAKAAHEDGLSASPDPASEEDDDDEPPPKSEADVLKRRRYGVDDSKDGDVVTAQPVVIDALEVAERVEMEEATRLPPMSTRQWVWLIGGVSASIVVAIALFIWIVRMSSDDDSDTPEITQALVPHLSLQVRGDKFESMLEVMTCTRSKRGRDRFPDSYEIEGKQVSIFGSFNIGFDGVWDELVGKPVMITAQDPAGTRGDSYVHMATMGDLKVARGTLVVKEVIIPSKRHNPYLRGEIDLELKKKDQRETIQAKGTFEVPVRILQ